MVPEKNSVTIEDYLEIIFVLQRDHLPVVGARLADMLNVTPPTVTNTLKRMARDGLISFNESQGTYLTEEGLKTAQAVMRRHMLSEWMLLDMLKVPWSRTHAEAHQFEHAVSEEIENQMQASLGNPQTCPHGNPLPGYEHVTSRWIPLDTAAAGDRVIIRRIHEMGENQPDLLTFLEKHEILPGKTAQVVDVLPFNQTLSLKIGDHQTTVGFAAAGYIYVEKVN